jgi:hypothetical protein
MYTLREYIANLQELVKEFPDTIDLPVVYQYDQIMKILKALG